MEFYGLATVLVVFFFIMVLDLKLNIFRLAWIGLISSAFVWILAKGLGPILEAIGAGGLFGLLFLSALVIGSIAHRRDKLASRQNRDN